ncbi:MAG: TlpA family protein disulfide reductase [Planctomycetaceae bacterium]|nr:TlpA family protein disulfide reductase [Planctomycetaceae bacterium]
MKNSALLTAICLMVCSNLLPGTTSKLVAGVTAVPAQTTPEKVKLTPAQWKDVKAFVGSQKGKVVVVDVWSTSCLPCMREFPNLLKLKQKYGDKLVCVSLNVDYAGIKSKPPTYYEPKVRKFLSRNPGDCKHFMSTVDAFDVFEELKVNSIPVAFVYGKDGKLAKRFDDKLLEPGEEDAFTYEKDINPFVAELLK